LTDLLDAIEQENQTFNDWLFAFGITVDDDQETFFSLDLEIAAEEGLGDLAIKYKFAYELAARPRNYDPVFRLVGTKPNLLAYLKNCYGEGEEFFMENAIEIK